MGSNEKSKRIKNKLASAVKELGESSEIRKRFKMLNTSEFLYRNVFAYSVSSDSLFPIHTLNY